MKIGIRSQPVVLAELIQALTQASGGASQLIHMLQDPRFIVIREAIDMMKDGCLKLAPKGLTEKPKVEARPKDVKLEEAV